jgi:hypothetical protein
MAPQRGSERLLAAWKNRELTDESVEEIGRALDESPASVDGVLVHGGTNATGISLALSYEGDDVAWCGNDLVFWFRWLRLHGGVARPPKIIINGIPRPDDVHLELDFGVVPEGGPTPFGPRHEPGPGTP